MKVCQNCGQPMEDDELFCGACGTKAEEPAPGEGAPAPEAAPEAVFCQNCGTKLEPGARFCANCGADTQAEPGTPAAKGQDSAGKAARSGKKIGMVAVGAVALVGVVLVVKLLGGLFASPAKKFTTYQKAFWADGVLGKVVEVADKVNGISDFTLSTDATLTADVKGNDMVSSVLEDSAIGLKLDLEKKGVKVGGELTLMGEPVINGMVSCQDKKLGFYVPALDDTYYTMDLMTLMELMGSNEYGSAENMEALDTLDEIEQVKIPTKLLERIGKRYIGIVLDVVNKDNIEVSKKEKIRMKGLGGSQTGTVYTVTPTAEDIEEMLLKLAESIETDKDLRQFVEQLIGDKNLELIADQADVDVNEAVEDALLELVVMLEDQAEDIAESLEGANFRWVLGLDGKNICKQAIELFDGEQTVSIGFEALSESKTREYAVYMTSPYEGTNAVTLSYEKDGGKYSGEVTVSGEGIPTAGGPRFEFEDVSGTRSALGLPHGVYTLSAGGERFTLEVEKNKGYVTTNS